jgi:hypothetical protein
LSGLKRSNRYYRRYLIEHMLYGDSRAAVVVALDPILVAAYTDELDCVALLRFADTAAVAPLKVGARLLTVNTYGVGTDHSADLVPGPQRTQRWQRFHPIIADFICADMAPVDVRKMAIADAEWERTLLLGLEYLAARPGMSRNGSPCLSAVPAEASP